MQTDYSKISLEGKKALFFDCDGTLADTMEAHNKAYELAFILNNIPFDKELHEKIAPLGGQKLMKATLANKGYEHKIKTVVADKQKLLDVCLDKYIKPNTALVNFIKEVKNNDPEIKVYVVTNGRKLSISKILKRLGIFYYIDGLISADVLGTLKPSPEPYNYAMVVASIDSGIKIKPEDTIVFEDNELGITSALGAGIKDIIKVNTEDFSYEKI